MTWSGLPRVGIVPHLLRDLVRYLHEASAQGQERADVGDVGEAAACRRAAGACQLCHAFCGLGFRLFFFRLQSSMDVNASHMLLFRRLRVIHLCWSRTKDREASPSLPRQPSSPAFYLRYEMQYVRGEALATPLSPRSLVPACIMQRSSNALRERNLCRSSQRHTVPFVIPTYETWKLIISRTCGECLALIALTCRIVRAQSTSAAQDARTMTLWPVLLNTIYPLLRLRPSKA